MSETLSSCCGASDRSTSYDGPSYGDLGLCSECRDHCEYIDADEDGVTFTDGSPIEVNERGIIQLREFSPEQQAIITAAANAPDGSTCCDDCLSPEGDHDFGYGGGPQAVPASCNDETCDCHTMPVNSLPITSNYHAALHRKLLFMLIMTAMVAFVSGWALGIKHGGDNALTVMEASR